MAHERIIALPTQAFDAVDVVLFDGSRRSGSLVGNETRLAFGAFLIGMVPPLVFHRIGGIGGTEFWEELDESFVDLRCGLCDVSNHSCKFVVLLVVVVAEFLVYSDAFSTESVEL